MKQLSTLYKRELKILFLSPLGWIFNALNLLALGVLTALMNLKNGLPSYEATAEAATLVFCLSIPVLSAFSFAAEIKRGETDMISRYASPSWITLGKYLAGLTAFAPSVVTAAILPLILNALGKVDLTAAYLGVLGYSLCGMALISMCTYVSAAVGRTLPALGISMAATVLLTVLSNAVHTFGHRQTVPFLIIALTVILLITIALYFYLKTLTAPMIFVVASSVLVAILMKQLPKIICELAAIIAPQHVFSDLIYGTVSFRGIISTLLFSTVFTVLTVLRLINRRETRR